MKENLDIILKRVRDLVAIVALLFSIFLAYSNLDKRISLLENSAVDKETLYLAIDDLKDEIRISVKQAIRELKEELKYECNR